MLFVWNLLSRRRWGLVRYNAIFQNLAALLYVALVFRLFRPEFLLLALTFFLLSTSMTAYGYYVNDLADLALDIQQRKPNAFLAMPRTKAILVVLTFLIIGVLLSVPFLHKTGFGITLAVWVALSSAYSLPPLRLKEKGAIGLAATVLSQQTLPVLLLFLAFAPVWDWGAVLFTGFATLRGLSSDISHQLRDAEEDARSGVRTFAVTAGKNIPTLIYALSLEAQAFLTGILIIWLVIAIPELYVGKLLIPFSPVWPIFLLYLLLLRTTAGHAWRAYRTEKLLEIDPYDERRQGEPRNAMHWIHHSFPTVLMPLWLGFAAGVTYLPNLLFVILIIVLYRLYSPDLWRKILPRRKWQLHLPFTKG